MSHRLQIAVARALKATRIDNQLSQEDLAQACELDRTYISGVERQTRNPTIKTIGKMLAPLAVSEQEFLQRVIDELNSDAI